MVSRKYLGGGSSGMTILFETVEKSLNLKSGGRSLRAGSQENFVDYITSQFPIISSL